MSTAALPGGVFPRDCCQPTKSHDPHGQNKRRKCLRRLAKTLARREGLEAPTPRFEGGASRWHASASGRPRLLLDVMNERARVLGHSNAAVEA
jgi:hypothetical protein